MNAKEIATLAHQGQFRRDGVTPYIKHPEAVASSFDEWELEHDVAWLHDVLEDTEITEELLMMHVPSVVVDAVKLLSKPSGEPYAEYIENLFFGYTHDNQRVSTLARRVKLADIASNLADAPTEHQIKKYTNALKIIAKNL